MSFLKKLFSKPKTPDSKPIFSKSTKVNAITFLFPKLPRLEMTQPIVWNNKISLTPTFDLITEGQELAAKISLGDHRLMLVGFSSPLPQDVQQRTIHFSNWPDQAKQAMFEHQAHVICYYESGSDDPVEQLFTMYKIAAAFKSQHLLGVADETAMTANPAPLIDEMFSNMPLEAITVAQALPYVVWLGIIKLFKPDGNIWWVSRGHERFNMPDLAYLTPPGQGEQVIEVFSNFLTYMHFYQARLDAGHTAELGGTQWRFVKPFEYHEYIETPSNTTLVVEINE
jgi:hypothetical protein